MKPVRLTLTKKLVTIGGTGLVMLIALGAVAQHGSRAQSDATSKLNPKAPMMPDAMRLATPRMRE